MTTHKRPPIQDSYEARRILFARPPWPRASRPDHLARLEITMQNLSMLPRCTGKRSMMPSQTAQTSSYAPSAWRNSVRLSFACFGREPNVATHYIFHNSMRASGHRIRRLSCIWSHHSPRKLLHGMVSTHRHLPGRLEFGSTTPVYARRPMESRVTTRTSETLKLADCTEAPRTLWP